ncbi:hypothetical protein KY289_030549 [Solanum tuberosum]|nr:hypothetical protein KY289_030549 [Solanum tuberosum]
MGRRVHSQEHGPPKNYPSLIPSRMRREAKLVVSCGEVLRARTHTIVHTKERDEDEECGGSSHHITIFDKESALPHATIEDKFVDVHTFHHISFNEGDPQEDEDAEDTPPELKEGIKNTVDTLKKGNTFDLLIEFRDVFSWSYKEMSGLDPRVVVLRLAVKRGVHPIKKAQHQFRPELVALIETEVNKLIEAGFIREVKYPTWISSIFPDEFPLPIHELMVDATTRYETMSFMDGSSGYNQIRMAPRAEELCHASKLPPGCGHGT